MATETKWEGKATAKVEGSKPEQVWPHLEDFCSFSKYLTTLDSSSQVEGVYGQPGLIRHCSAAVASATGGDEKEIKWCREKLLSIDPVKRCLTYEVLDNNLGFKSYVAAFKVLPADVGDGSLIEWSFVSDPIEGMTFDGLLGYVDSSVHTIAENIAKAVR